MKYILFIVFLFFTACQTKKETDASTASSDPKPFLVKTESISIPLVQPATHQGHFIDNNRDLFYSYHINTQRLYIYDKKGVIDSLHLYKHGLFLNQMLVTNLDSIFIIDYVDRHIKQIDIKGNVKKDINFKTKYHQDSINPYLHKGQTAQKGRLLLDVSFSNTKYSNLSQEDRIKKYNSIPLYIYLKEDQIKYPNFNYLDVERISAKDPKDDSELYSDLAITKKYIALTLKFNNQIYLFNKEADYIKNVPIKSMYTGTDVNKDYSFYTEVDRSETFITNFDYATMTNFILYNKIKNRTYLLLAHKTDISVEQNKINKHSNRSFSIISYDEDFVKQAEQKFKKNLYKIYDPIYVDSKGNLLLNANHEMNPNFLPNYLQYDVYKEI